MNGSVETEEENEINKYFMEEILSSLYLMLLNLHEKMFLREQRFESEEKRKP